MYSSMHFIVVYRQADRQAVDRQTGRQIDRHSGRRKAFSGRHVVGGQGTTGSLIK